MPQIELDESGLSTWNCWNCRRRKVRCDRRSPCANCTKLGAHCTFPVSGRVPRRQPRDDNGSGSGIGAGEIAAVGGGGTGIGGVARRSKQRQLELMGRLRRLEGVVEDLTAQLEGVGADRRRRASGSVGSDEQMGVLGVVSRTSSNETPPPSGASHELVGLEHMDKLRDALLRAPAPKEDDPGILLVDKNGSVYLGTHYWTTLRRELNELRWRFELVQDDEKEDDDSDITTSDIFGDGWSASDSTVIDRPSFAFGGPTTGVKLDIKDFRPLPSQMLFIWQTYVENVDPISKVLHVPSVTKQIQDCRGQFGLLTPSEEALMFAVSLAAILSMSEEEVEINFNSCKEQLTERLRQGTELALSRADFLHSSNLMVVQALTIFLTVLSPDKKLVWSLTGLLLRVAISLGLHRDGSAFMALTPFETEMRRRLWWHICFLDNCLDDKMLVEASIPYSLFDTQPPTNVDDTDLSPEMTAPPVARQGITSIAYCLIRCDIFFISRHVQASMSPQPSSSSTKELTLAEGQAIYADFKARIETKYLPYLTSEDAAVKKPTHSQLRNICALALDKYKLITHYKRPTESAGAADVLTEDDDKECFALSVSILRRTHTLRQGSISPGGLCRGFPVQWHALMIALAQLMRRCSWGAEEEQAWGWVARTFQDVPEDAKKEASWVCLCRLAAKVKKRRALELKGDTGPNGRLAKMMMKCQRNEPTLGVASQENDNGPGADRDETLGPSQATDSRDASNSAADTLDVVDEAQMPSLPDQTFMEQWAQSDVFTGVGVDNFAPLGTVESMEWEGWDAMLRPFEEELSREGVEESLVLHHEH